MSKKSELEVEGCSLVVANLDRVLYPAAGFTKADVIDYYIRIGPTLLPHRESRPITLNRYPALGAKAKGNPAGVGIRGSGNHDRHACVPAYAGRRIKRRWRF